ncbi:DUF4468 domain-containing protein [Niabella sp. CJ426]|uniref:DUF4468 domain-containing protein n=1 Tax=Niabella sp. CJ426 TaxID=3393740 RepID=UPI003D040A67
MKSFVVVILFLLCFPIVGISQFDKSDFTFQRIDSVKASKQELYFKAKSWLIKKFIDSKEVIQVDDKESGKLIAKSTIKTPHKAMAGFSGYDNTEVVISVDVKDNKYRIRFYDLIHPYGGEYKNDKPKNTMMLNKSGWDKVKERTIEIVEPLISEFNTYMKTIKNDNF